MLIVMDSVEKDAGRKKLYQIGWVTTIILFEMYLKLKAMVLIACHLISIDRKVIKDATPILLFSEYR